MTPILIVLGMAGLALQAFPAHAGADSAVPNLSVERIFADPDLSGARLRNPRFSPDGRYVAYLQGRPDDKDQLDLWVFDTRLGKARMLIDSHASSGGQQRPSAEEQSRRERQRIASLRGIVDYEFSNNGSRLLIPLDGDLYLYELSARTGSMIRLTSTDAYETDARFSPGGRYVSFVRDQNLFAIDLHEHKEIRITSDGSGPIGNGVAEFIAQEEMGRDTGYWWSPDDRRIAYTRTDDAGVQEIERYEINADGARMYRQRYPAAGTPNVHVTLKVVDIGSLASTEFDLQLHGYLARVNWFPDSRHLAVQRQTRDQKRLDLLKVDVASGRWRVMLTETSPHWVELHDDLRFLKERPAFIWASRRSGFRHLYLHDLNGRLIRPLTAGEWMVTGDGTESALAGIDESRARVYFMANAGSPLERHLYATSLDTRDPAAVTRISREPGWHDARLLPGGRQYLDLWSSPERPPSASLRRLDGTVHHWLLRNALDAAHPYAPYRPGHVPEEYGSLRTDDGQTLYFRLQKPTGFEAGKRYPVVIDIYGGPHFQYVRKDWMGGTRAAQGYFRQILARNGFVVFTLDNRGSGFRGNAFETAIAGRLGRIEVRDQLLGVEFLKALPFVDAGRIGIMGWSYGGYLSLMAATTSTAFKAAVAGAPVTDWSLYDTHYTERYLGMPKTNAEGYRLSSVLTHAEGLRGGLLLVHGMADDNVLFTHSTLLMQQLQALGKPFDVMTYPGAKHSLIRMPGTGRHYYEMVLRFFLTAL